MVHGLIDAELASGDFSPEDIFLAGHSQGGALALYSAITYSQQVRRSQTNVGVDRTYLGGACSFNSWLPLEWELTTTRDIIATSGEDAKWIYPRRILLVCCTKAADSLLTAEKIVTIF